MARIIGAVASSHTPTLGFALDTLAAGLVADEFDLSYFQDKPLDHGCFSPLSMLWPHEPTWPGAIVPLQIGVLEFPIPSAQRCYKLGHALRRAIESYPKDLKVVLVATGGLSHQVYGERCGFNNPDWDLEFLDLIEKHPARLAAMTHAEYATRGGVEGAEVIPRRSRTNIPRTAEKFAPSGVVARHEDHG